MKTKNFAAFAVALVFGLWACQNSNEFGKVVPSSILSDNGPLVSPAGHLFANSLSSVMTFLQDSILPQGESLGSVLSIDYTDKPHYSAAVVTYTVKSSSNQHSYLNVFRYHPSILVFIDQSSIRVLGDSLKMAPESKGLLSHSAVRKAVCESANGKSCKFTFSIGSFNDQKFVCDCSENEKTDAKSAQDCEIDIESI